MVNQFDVRKTLDKFKKAVSLQHGEDYVLKRELSTSPIPDSILEREFTVDIPPIKILYPEKMHPSRTRPRNGSNAFNRSTKIQEKLEENVDLMDLVREERRSVIKENTIPEANKEKKEEVVSHHVKRGHDFYLRCKEHHVLYGFARTYLEDIKEGRKHFGFLDQSGETQKNMALAMCSLIAKELDDDVLIVCEEELFTEFFKELKASSLITKKDDSVLFKFDNIHLLKMLDYPREDDSRLPQHEKTNIEIKRYKFIYFALPTFFEIKRSYRFYHPIIKAVEKVSLFSKRKEITFNEVEEISGFFRNHGAQMKGLFL